MPTAFSGLIHPWHPLLLISTLNTNIHVLPPKFTNNSSPYHRGNELYVHFHSQPDFPVFTFGTCGNQISVCTLITDKDSFMLGLASVMPGHQYTMPWTYTVRLTPVLYILHPSSFLFLNHTANVLIHASNVLSVTFKGLEILLFL